MYGYYFAYIVILNGFWLGAYGYVWFWCAIFICLRYLLVLIMLCFGEFDMSFDFSVCDFDYLLSWFRFVWLWLQLTLVVLLDYLYLICLLLVFIAVYFVWVFVACFCGLLFGVWFRLDLFGFLTWLFSLECWVVVCYGWFCCGVFGLDGFVDCDTCLLCGWFWFSVFSVWFLVRGFCGFVSGCLLLVVCGGLAVGMWGVLLSGGGFDLVLFAFYAWFVGGLVVLLAGYVSFVGFDLADLEILLFRWC